MSVPERPRLSEVIPLLTANLFSRSPPVCTEEVKTQIQFIPGMLPQVCRAERWVADGRGGGRRVGRKKVLIEGRREKDEMKNMLSLL